jgi:hypothetical protein
MVTDQYSHIIDENRKGNAKLFKVLSTREKDLKLQRAKTLLLIPLGSLQTLK